jgi:hypothetical protein
MLPPGNIANNGFSVNVNRANKRNINGHKYFALPHMGEYSLTLKNGGVSRCDAHVWIDGNKVGVWRINSYSDITIERPVDKQRKFTFFKEDSEIAETIGIRSGRDSNGLIKVVFKPEKLQDIFEDRDDCFDGPYRYCSMNASRSLNKGIARDGGILERCVNQSVNYESQPASFNNFSGGATGLGKHSDQRFNNVSAIYNIDTSNITTIELRLIVDNDFARDHEFVPLTPQHFIKAPPKITAPPHIDSHPPYFSMFR